MNIAVEFFLTNSVSIYLCIYMIFTKLVKFTINGKFEVKDSYYKGRFTRCDFLPTTSLQLDYVSTNERAPFERDKRTLIYLPLIYFTCKADEWSFWQANSCSTSDTSSNDLSLTSLDNSLTIVTCLETVPDIFLN